MVISWQKGVIVNEEIDYEWLDSVLDEDLKAIVEDLEAGGKISAAEFTHLVELYREHYTVEDEEEKTDIAEWRD